MMKRTCTILLFATVSAITAAGVSLSLNSPDDYIFTKLLYTNAIEGVGMGKDGDYPTMRIEDIAFLNEAFVERCCTYLYKPALTNAPGGIVTTNTASPSPSFEPSAYIKGYGSTIHMYPSGDPSTHIVNWSAAYLNSQPMTRQALTNVIHGVHHFKNGEEHPVFGLVTNAPAFFGFSDFQLDAWDNRMLRIPVQTNFIETSYRLYDIYTHKCALYNSHNVQTSVEPILIQDPPVTLSHGYESGLISHLDGKEGWSAESYQREFDETLTNYSAGAMNYLYSDAWAEKVTEFDHREYSEEMQEEGWKAWGKFQTWRKFASASESPQEGCKFRRKIYLAGSQAATIENVFVNVTISYRKSENNGGEASRSYNIHSNANWCVELPRGSWTVEPNAEGYELTVTMDFKDVAEQVLSTDEGTNAEVSGLIPYDLYPVIQNRVSYPKELDVKGTVTTGRNRVSYTFTMKIDRFYIIYQMQWNAREKREN